jgi:SAM-dependent methyltransferase
VTSLIDYARGEGTLREWARVVRPGGRVLLSVLLREDLVSVDADMVAAGFILDAFEITGQDRVSVWTRARGLSIMPP